MYCQVLKNEKALSVVNIINNTRDGTIKGRTYVNGGKQRQYFIGVEIIVSPNVSLEALFTTLITDSHEERYVATFDVSGSYLHANMP